MATDKVRRQIASEAARLMFSRQEGEYQRAKRKAARQLGHGWVKGTDLPSNREVRAELHNWVRRRDGDDRREELSALRLAAFAWMQRLRSFRPRLLGDAVTGQLGDRPLIELQLFAAHPHEVERLLQADQLDYEVEVRMPAPPVRSPSVVRFRIDRPERLALSVYELRRARQTYKRSSIAQPLERLGISDLAALLRRDGEGPHGDESLLESMDEPDRFERYASLLAPLEQVKQSLKHHPEGDALYHSLQVFTLAREQIPYDEEFLTAALLHDVGKAIDAQSPVAAAIDALADAITPRTAWLIEHHEEGHALREGTLGLRSRRRLMAHEDYEELMLLVQCDRQGRRRGARVPDVEEALGYLRELAVESEAD